MSAGAAASSIGLWYQEESNPAGSASQLGVEAGKLAAAWIEVAHRECACELDRVIRPQRVTRRLSRSRNQHRLRQREDREAWAGIRVAVEVELERADQDARRYVLEFAGPGLTPQRCGHLHTRER
jgi:hypothetical protein